MNINFSKHYSALALCKISSWNYQGPGNTTAFQQQYDIKDQKQAEKLTLFLRGKNYKHNAVKCQAGPKSLGLVIRPYLSTTIGGFSGHFKMGKITTTLQYKPMLQSRCLFQKHVYGNITEVP